MKAYVPFLSIFTVSFALLVDEIMLSAIFNVLLGAGNTVTAIALALVGLSASGILAFAIPAFHEPDRSRPLARSLVFWFSVSLIVSAVLLMNVPLNHGDLIYARHDVGVRLWRLAVYQLAVVPFFLGGLAIAALLRTHASVIGQLYFSDLSGAAAGCLASPLLLAQVGAPWAILCAAVPAALLGARLAPGSATRRAAHLALPLGLFALVALQPGLLRFAKLNTMGDVDAPRFRSFDIDGDDIAFERWALDAWTIIRSDRIPQQWENFEGWGLSPSYRGAVPRTVLVNYNARFSTYVTELAGGVESISSWLDADLISFHYLLGRHYESVLNIGAGGGREVLNALNHGAERIVAVDVSDVTVNDVMKGELREFSGGIYFDPRVTAVAAEGRTFAERSQERFDLIDFSIVGGINLEKMDLVRVDDLFTREALRTYLSRLDEDGVFSYVAYTTRADLVAELAARPDVSAQPYIPALRTLAGLRLALEESDPGARFRDHVLIAALPGRIADHYDLAHIAVGRSRFTDAERQRFLALCDELGFTVLYPVAGPTARAQVSLYAAIIESDDLAALSASLPFSIWPPTDDRPFQYALDASRIRRALERGGLWGLLAGNPLLSLGTSIGLLAVVLTLIPVAVVRTRRGSGRVTGRSAWLLLVFACIGFGYMAVEISVLLRLQSYLGKPIYGLAVGLFAFLLSSGLGSALTSRFAAERLVRHTYVIVALLVAVGVLFSRMAAPLFAETIALPVAARAAIAVAMAFPLAFPMGMLFPIGIRLLSGESEDLIPWAWGTNGCLSVVGIVGTRMTALVVGFSGALLLGLTAYLAVAGCAFLYARQRGAAETG